ncbi:MAG: metallophosphoesterase [Lachnospiraceae bacterium]|nr:metallophosphoesterase [Lachnospiraceae bacterium]
MDGGASGSGMPVADLPVYREEVNISIPGAAHDETILWLSDLHIVGVSEQTDQEKLEEVSQRISYSSGAFSVPASAQWAGVRDTKGEVRSWVDTLNDEQASLVIFGGDMLDYDYPEGIELLREGFDRLNKPYIYARADHDLLPTYMADGDDEAAKKRQDDLCKNEDVMSYAFDDLYVVVWNNSTSNISESGLERIKQLAAEGKPMILVTHVPVQPLEDESLDEASKATYGDRILLWGYRDTYYWPDENTRQLLDMIYGFDGNVSPFKEILAGHMHFSWSGTVAPGVHQTVFAAGFDGNMGVIRVGEQQK